MNPNNYMTPNGQMSPNPNIFMAPQPGQAPHPMVDPPKRHKAPVGLILITVILVIATITFTILTVMFYSQMSDYKNNSDKKSTAAVEQAKKEQEASLSAQFAEREKEPLRSYTSPSSAAGVKIVYPKTWSVYEIIGTNGATVDGYFNPLVVPDIGKKENVYALRLEVLDKQYPTVVEEYSSDLKKGTITSTPYIPEKMPNAQAGVLLEGKIRNDISGSMIIVPALASTKTIRLWTETGNYTNDFNNFVLKNLEYSP